jgi:prepilin-type N-terminal cleavage/methylation domain-containing protein
MHKKRGITLIELLVTIAILALLAVAVSISFTSVRQKSRDARRKQDVNGYVVALEKYKITSGNYLLKTNSSAVCSANNTDCAGINGLSWGRMNYKGKDQGGLYNTHNSIAELITKLGLIAGPVTDPTNHGSVTTADKLDYVMMRCFKNAAGADQITSPTSSQPDLYVSVWAKLERPLGEADQENAKGYCGGTRTNLPLFGYSIDNQVIFRPTTDGYEQYYAAGNQQIVAP